MPSCIHVRQGKDTVIRRNSSIVNTPYSDALATHVFATVMLERIHNKWPDNKDVNEELCAVRLEEVRRMMDAEQWQEAITILEDLTIFDVDKETKYAIDRRLFTCYLKAGFRNKALAQLEKIDSDKEKSAQLYEEVMMPYIKSLIAQEVCRVLTPNCKRCSTRAILHPTCCRRLHRWLCR